MLNPDLRKHHSNILQNNYSLLFKCDKVIEGKERLTRGGGVQQDITMEYNEGPALDPQLEKKTVMEKLREFH